MFDRTHKKTPEELRSARWFAPDDLRSFGHRSRVMQMGYGVGRLHGQADHRHPQHLVRPQPLPRALQAARRGREARRARGRRLPGRDAGDHALRELHEADDDALPQPPRDRDRGADPRAPGRWRRADGRLRQDHAGPDHGRALRRPADDLPARRPDAARQLRRPATRLGLGRLEVLGRAPRRQHQREAVARRRERHRPLLRPLHDHGHRLDDDGDRRLDGPDAPRRLLDPGAPTPTTSACPRNAAGASSRWSGRI